MAFQVTLTAGRTADGQRQVSISFGGDPRNRDETRKPDAERTRQRPPKTRGRHRESLGRRTWRRARQSRAMAAARVAGGFGRNVLAQTPLGRLVAGITAASQRGGRNVQQRWTNVRGRRQALGQQVAGLRGQIADAQREIRALQAQLAALDQSRPQRTPGNERPSQRGGTNGRRTGRRDRGRSRDDGRSTTRQQHTNTRGRG